MKKRLAAVSLGAILVMTLGGPATTMTATANPAAKSYPNCDKLHRQFYRYGVAKTKKAANRQYRTGHYRPRVNRNVYLANDHLDADKDRTACEVTR